MPHSLKSRIKSLCYKGEITEKERDKIIEALGQMTCEDCISRKRVIMLIDEATEIYPYKIIGLPNTYSDYNQGWTDACNWLYANIESDNLPSVTPKAESEDKK